MTALTDLTEVMQNTVRSGELAEVLQISKKTLWRWVDSGRLPQPLNRCKGSEAVWSEQAVRNIIDAMR